MADTGVKADDFSQILADFTRTVSYKVVTKTTNDLTGDETSSYAASSNVNLVFFKEDCRYIFDKEGLLQVGDAYVMAPITTGIKRYDQFTVDGFTYYIENIIKRYILGTAMFDYGVCFLVQ
jgi:hypothetical protein